MALLGPGPGDVLSADPLQRSPPSNPVSLVSPVPHRVVPLRLRGADRGPQGQVVLSSVHRRHEAPRQPAQIELCPAPPLPPVSRSSSPPPGSWGRSRGSRCHGLGGQESVSPPPFPPALPGSESPGVKKRSCARCRPIPGLGPNQELEYVSDERDEGLKCVCVTSCSALIVCVCVCVCVCACVYVF